MNYQKIYDKIIENARVRPPITEYIERHHIIPKSLGGSDTINNIIELTAREHFLAHYLLYKIHKDDSKYSSTVIYAFNAMRWNNEKRYTSRSYEKALRIFSELKSKLSKKEQLEIFHKYCENIKNKHIIKELEISYSVSSSTIRRTLKLFEIKFKERKTPTYLKLETKNIIYERVYINKEISSSEAKKFYDISDTQLSRIISERGGSLDELKKISEDTKNTIIDLYNRGHSILDIHKSTKINRKRIRELLQDSGLKIKSNQEQNGQLSIEEENKICDLYKEKEKITEVSKISNLKYSHVRSILLRHNIKTQKSTFTEEQEKNIVSDYKEDSNMAKLAKKYGVSSSTPIKTVLKKHKIKICSSKKVNSRGIWHTPEGPFFSLSEANAANGIKKSTIRSRCLNCDKTIKSGEHIGYTYKDIGWYFEKK